MENENKISTETKTTSDTKSKRNLIIIGVGTVLSLIALLITKNFIYFVLTALIVLALYAIINAKSNKSKKTTAKITAIGFGVLSGLGLFAYFYSMWILPFMIDMLHLPTLNNIEGLESLKEVGRVFLIMGLVFAGITLVFTIIFWIIKKNENPVEAEIEK